MGADRKKAFFMLIAGSCECSVGVALVPCQARGEIQACRADSWNPGFTNGQNRRAVTPKARREARCIPLAPLEEAAESSLQLWGGQVGVSQVESRRKPNIYLQPDFQKR